MKGKTPSFIFMQKIKLFLIYFVLIIKISSLAINNSIILEFNNIGNQQVLYSYFSQSPSIIYLNSNKVSFSNYKIYISSKSDKITLIWNYTFNHANNMFYGLSNITKIDFTNFNFQSIYNMTMTFYNCINLINIYFGNSKIKNINSMKSLFSGCVSLESLNLSNFDTSKVTSMYNLFYNCSKLEKIIIYEFKNTLTTDMYGIFYYCINLKSLDLSHFYTTNSQIMWNMFKGDSSLLSLNLSSFDTSQVTDMESMFDGCSSLISLDISNFRTSKVYYMNKMFRNCSKLEYLNFRNINTNSIGRMEQMFYQCRSLRYLNLYNITREYSTSEMFSGVANNFIYCINSFSNIPNIKSYLNELFAQNSCSNKCFLSYEYNIQLCCGNYIYNSNCVSSCPKRTYLSNKNCIDLKCQNYYSYNQDKCIDEIPEGYFLNDTSLKTIDKCHSDCKTCNRLNTSTNSFCTTCKSSKYFYLGNCYTICPKGSYFDEENSMNKCKCFEDKCLQCSEESLKNNLCISCNEGYYPKYNDPYNVLTYINCYKKIEGYYLENNSIFKQCYERCNSCDKKGDEQNHNCLACKNGYNYQKLNRNYKNCYDSCEYYYYIDKSNNKICLNIFLVQKNIIKLFLEKNNVLIIAVKMILINTNLDLSVIKNVQKELKHHLK